MKIEVARIRNFKLIRRIDLEFSCDKMKPLTVIRAENGSGKTSTLHALRWAFYGNQVLEDPSVRISPAYWPNNSECEISVEVDFVCTAKSVIDGTSISSQTRYMLKREVKECPVGDYPNRRQERVSLYKKTKAGSDPIDAPETELEQILPKEMIDIFFTDGDAAMTFISPSVSENIKKDMVKDAIRSLLGLGLLESVEKRISLAQSQVNKLIAKDASSKHLVQVTKEIEILNKNKDDIAQCISALKIAIDNTRRSWTALEKELTKVLEAGNFEHLAHQRENYRKQFEDARDEDERNKKCHQELFQQEILSWGLLESTFEKGYAHLEKLHAKGIIPKAAVPVLEERLELGKCICGADLSKGTKAHESVHDLIEQNRENDKESDSLSALYHHTKQAHFERNSSNSDNWKDLVKIFARQRIEVKNRIDVADRELRSIKAKIEQIDEDEIKQKQMQLEMLKSVFTKNEMELTKKETKQKELDEEITKKTHYQTKLRQADNKIKMLNAEKTILNDLHSIVHESLLEMQGTYLRKVSDRLNRLFLFMVGSDQDEGATFQGTAITDEYRIVVNTIDSRTLNPDHEVNGASQRALTFAFIWALTEVSGVVAPRIIDTPLGTMSGNVKRRVLETITKSDQTDVDKQVVLFLTQAEISHTEDILDKYVGSSCTLIKTDDYPKELINEPNASQSEIRICDCSYRQFCRQCQRINFDDFGLTFRPV